MLKRMVYFLVHSFFLVFGYLYFMLTGKNTERGYQAMVYLFCHTGGRANVWLANFERTLGRPLNNVEGNGVLGAVVDMQTFGLNALRKHGFLVKERALSSQVCERLMNFALATPAVVRPMDGEAKDGLVRMEVVNLTNPSAVRYDYQVSDLLANSDIQDLMADPSLLALAESYLGAAPKLDVLGMWWHFNLHDKPDSEAAQMYHFDMDRARWLKIFIYLTDVGLDNGPHSFIEGTHLVGSIPERFMHRGYVRLSDKDVIEEYGASREMVFAAPVGSIIAEDTIGLHKGGVVTGKARLLLQLQFSSSLFGARYQNAQLPYEKTPALQRMILSNPFVYKAYL